jgi:predicted nucleic acid-binding Zn ribbon protein
MYRITGNDPGPEPLREILARLFTARGWGRRQARLHLEKAWADAVGPKQAPQTRVLGLRRGILEVEVQSAILLQELAQFHKRKLLERLRERLPNHTLTDLRFRAGTWEV